MIPETIVRYRNKPYLIIRQTSDYYYAMDLAYLAKGRQSIDKIGISSCVPITINTENIMQVVDNKISQERNRYEQLKELKNNSASLFKLVKFGMKFKYIDSCYGDSIAIYLGKCNKKHMYCRFGISNNTTIYNKTSKPLVTTLLEDVNNDLIIQTVTNSRIDYKCKLSKDLILTHVLNTINEGK